MSAAEPAASKARLEKLRADFSRLDVDGSGTITVCELAVALAAGTKMTTGQARSLATGVIAKYDADGNGELDVRFGPHTLSSAMKV
jgi:Ca2+-binding EF-hand superfamily protein